MTPECGRNVNNGGNVGGSQGSRGGFDSKNHEKPRRWGERKVDSKIPRKSPKIPILGFPPHSLFDKYLQKASAASLLEITIDQGLPECCVWCCIQKKKFLNKSTGEELLRRGVSGGRSPKPMFSGVFSGYSRDTF